MKFCASLVAAALVAVATAQSAKLVKNNSQNGRLPATMRPSHNPIVLTFNDAGKGQLSGATPLRPLTAEAKDHVPHNPHTSEGIHGKLRLNDADTSLKLRRNDFAFTDCDPSRYSGEFDLPRVIQDAIRNKVKAIVFYTTKEDHYCQLSDEQGYGSYANLYTLLNHGAVRKILNYTSQPARLRRNEEQTIYTEAAYMRWLNNQQRSFADVGAGSTAVAMIILYSITGVITALFLVIIVTGAVRAHRHPERYGPRSVLGRPRQSRAKGIARAMLDTIPIVKFGERLPDASKEVESGSSISMEPQPEQRAAAAPGRDETQASPGASERQHEASSSSAASAPVAPIAPSDPAKATSDEDEGLGCSICTEDFERGQDIRVLPCNHKFHPACVDPWLLDVSGTCPLCRVDLNPAAAGDDRGEGSESLPPPLDPASDEAALGARRNTLRGFISSRLNMRGLQGTSREERLDILRRWREAHGSQSAAAGTTTTTPTVASATAEAGDADERLTRLSRFSRLVRRRDR